MIIFIMDEAANYVLPYLIDCLFGKNPENDTFTINGKND